MTLLVSVAVSWETLLLCWGEGNARNIETHICILSRYTASPNSLSLIRAINIICQTHEYFMARNITIMAGSLHWRAPGQEHGRYEHPIKMIMPAWLVILSPPQNSRCNPLPDLRRRARNALARVPRGNISFYHKRIICYKGEQ